MEAQESYQCGSVTYWRDARGLYFPANVPETVKRVITEACGTSRRLRLFYGDRDTGKAWPEENGVAGSIGASMGPCRVPLLLHNSRSDGGGSILTGCIVGIKAGQYWLYQHPSFDVGAWTIGAPVTEGYQSAVYHNGELHAQFKRAGCWNAANAATRYIAFMKGERMAK